MSDEAERLGRIETHLEYIRRALDGWDKTCADHRSEQDRRISELRPGAEFAMFVRWVLVVTGKVIAVLAALAGIAKVVLAHV